MATILSEPPSPSPASIPIDKPTIKPLSGDYNSNSKEKGLHTNGNGSEGSTGDDIKNGNYDGTVSPTKSSNGSGNGINGDKLAYNEDDADFKLRSLDGRVFKVHSYQLKAHSSVFRDLLSTDPPTPQPFPIQASTKHLKLLLDLMHLKPSPSGAIFSARHHLFKLCDEYNLKAVAERALFSMHENVEKYPWAILSIASQRNSVALAKSAMRALDNYGYGVENGKDTVKREGVKEEEEEGGLEIRTIHAKDISIGYLLGIFNASLKVSINKGKGEKVTWREVAEVFQPVL